MCPSDPGVGMPASPRFPPFAPHVEEERAFGDGKCVHSRDWDDDGFILYESRAISRCIAAKYPESGPIPTDPRAMRGLELYNVRSPSLSPDSDASEGHEYARLETRMLRCYHASIPTRQNYPQVGRSLKWLGRACAAWAWTGLGMPPIPPTILTPIALICTLPHLSRNLPAILIIVISNQMVFGDMTYVSLSVSAPLAAVVPLRSMNTLGILEFFLFWGCFCRAHFPHLIDFFSSTSSSAFHLVPGMGMMLATCLLLKWFVVPQGLGMVFEIIEDFVASRGSKEKFHLMREKAVETGLNKPVYARTSPFCKWEMLVSCETEPKYNTKGSKC
ncbi:hypothetical protein DFH07DRAFT_766856 [Mycena maculata]|uniref:Uncharacterized protein n=1 Tax=Mycena maculata TaxID=230809 RepID=A0AAD7NUQ3_9AGAR|nr:hypothetical protein DFH07DRAFT_766856 [Mycena maculata]